MRETVTVTPSFKTYCHLQNIYYIHLGGGARTYRTFGGTGRLNSPLTKGLVGRRYGWIDSVGGLVSMLPLLLIIILLFNATYRDGGGGSTRDTGMALFSGSLPRVGALIGKR